MHAAYYIQNTTIFMVLCTSDLNPRNSLRQQVPSLSSLTTAGGRVPNLVAQQRGYYPKWQATLEHSIHKEPFLPDQDASWSHPIVLPSSQAFSACIKQQTRFLCENKVTNSLHTAYILTIVRYPTIYIYEKSWCILSSVTSGAWRACD